MEELKNILAFNKAQPSIEAEALAKNECPECGWKLKVNKEGQKACQFCEKVY
jgi:ribosomal protein L37AE/L43A